jgi:hypothetical protein
VLQLLSVTCGSRYLRSDAKSVSIMALGCLHPVVKVQSAALHFFLGSDQEEGDSDVESEEACLPRIPLVL